MWGNRGGLGEAAGACLPGVLALAVLRLRTESRFGNRRGGLQQQCGLGAFPRVAATSMPLESWTCGLMMLTHTAGNYPNNILIELKRTLQEHPPELLGRRPNLTHSG